MMIYFPFPLPMDSAIAFVPRPSTVLGLGSLLDGTVKCLAFLCFSSTWFFLTLEPQRSFLVALTTTLGEFHPILENKKNTLFFN